MEVKLCFPKWPILDTGKGNTGTMPIIPSAGVVHIVGEPDPKFGKVQGRRGTEGLMTDSYVKIPDGSESGLRLWAQGGATWPKLRSKVKGHVKFGNH